MKLRARRQINFDFKTPAFIHNLNLLARTAVAQVPHHDTLLYLLKLIPFELTARVRKKMIHRLIRMKCFVSQRFLGLYYLIAIDATGQLVYARRHCDHCLAKKHNDKVLYYYHPVLEAKLVFPNGIAFSIGTEFIENPAPDVDVQDCEQVAFYRLVEQVKKDFPQLRICLLLDGLYAAAPVFARCNQYGWKYIITFKEGSMPAVWQDYLGIKILEKDNHSLSIHDTVSQEFWWVNAIEHSDQHLNVLECRETKSDSSVTRFVWMTNLSLTKDNHQEIANKGGRLRWKIENEGFNMQKNGGYELEHAYCEDVRAQKNFYILLQIAHILSQLMEKGSLIKGEVKKVFGSIRNFARRLLEDFRVRILPPAQLQSLLAVSFQIRFNTS
ncbi:MAG: hypothetical protein NTZ78_07260 [Candidatus Aureabacteria bacterium]|nr:hypothetical protein [Candidatus Auribacterota bacterium]